MEQERLIVSKTGFGLGLVLLALRVNGKVLTPAPHSVPSALPFVLCLLLLIAGILQIPRVKRLDLLIEKKKLKLPAFQCLIE